MSVLIKGMKMPEKCGSCDLFHVESPMHCTAVKGHKTVGAPYGMPRPDWCPLVEISEPHGDLIDRDAPEIIFCHECKHWKDSDGVYRRGINAESKCPVNSRQVYEGTFFCGMAERRTDGERREV